MLRANTFHFNSKRIVWCYTNMHEISLYNVQASSKQCSAVFPIGNGCFYLSSSSTGVVWRYPSTPFIFKVWCLILEAQFYFAQRITCIGLDCTMFHVAVVTMLVLMWIDISLVELLVKYHDHIKDWHILFRTMLHFE